MVNLKLSGINEIEIVTTALFEYRCTMLRFGNSSRASKLLELIDRLDASSLISSSDCPDDCLNCPNFLNLKECGYETSNHFK